ncbi:DUF4260 family protein [Celeribacter sp. ULVN23_4]
MRFSPCTTRSSSTKPDLRSKQQSQTFPSPRHRRGFSFARSPPDDRDHNGRIPHAGFDRALGYGLKSPEAFVITLLGRIGKSEP